MTAKPPRGRAAVPVVVALAYFFHALPAWWHRIESNLTLVWEIGVPFLIWGPRPARLFAFAVFTCFQIINIITANYGFFSYLALFLGVFLLDDGDIWRLRAFVASRLPPWLERAARKAFCLRSFANWSPRLPVRPRRVLRCTIACIVSGVWLVTSVDTGLSTFAHQKLGILDSVADFEAPFRLVNDYHLFMQVTRERIEPTFETQTGGKWTEQTLHYKPGPLTRAPPLVAPHQPRVDFLLWFYGLSFREAMPSYVAALLEHLCHSPSTVQPVFVGALPKSPNAVRITFYRYQFASPGSKNWWARTELARTPAFSCR